jgi:hypothetical protein
VKPGRGDDLLEEEGGGRRGNSVIHSAIEGPRRILECFAYRCSCRSPRRSFVLPDLNSGGLQFWGPRVGGSGVAAWDCHWIGRVSWVSSFSQSLHRSGRVEGRALTRRARSHRWPVGPLGLDGQTCVAFQFRPPCSSTVSANIMQIRKFSLSEVSLQLGRQNGIMLFMHTSYVRWASTRHVNCK